MTRPIDRSAEWAHRRAACDDPATAQMRDRPHLAAVEGTVVDGEEGAAWRRADRAHVARRAQCDRRHVVADAAGDDRAAGERAARDLRPRGRARRARARARIRDRVRRASAIAATAFPADPWPPPRSRLRRSAAIHLPRGSTRADRRQPVRRSGSQRPRPCQQVRRRSGPASPIPTTQGCAPSGSATRIDCPRRGLHSMPNSLGRRCLDASVGANLPHAPRGAGVLGPEHEQERAVSPQLERPRSAGAEQLGRSDPVPEQARDHDAHRLGVGGLGIVDVRTHGAPAACLASQPGPLQRASRWPVPTVRDRSPRSRLDEPIAALGTDREADQVALAVAAHPQARADPRRPAAQRPGRSAGRIVGPPADLDAPALGDERLDDRDALGDRCNRAPGRHRRARDPLTLRADTGARIEVTPVGADVQQARVDATVAAPPGTRLGARPR